MADTPPRSWETDGSRLVSRILTFAALELRRRWPWRAPPRDRTGSVPVITSAANL